jgi:antitoxin ChpS
MYTTNLRKVGGSIMLAVPPALLDVLHLRAGATVAVTLDGRRLVVERQERPHYTLDELLSLCDGSIEPSQEDRDWIDAPPAGEELV